MATGGASPKASPANACDVVPMPLPVAVLAPKGAGGLEAFSWVRRIRVGSLRNTGALAFLAVVSHWCLSLQSTYPPASGLALRASRRAASPTFESGEHLDNSGESLYPMPRKGNPFRSRVRGASGPNRPL